jgi:uncharacterized protein
MQLPENGERGMQVTRETTALNVVSAWDRGRLRIGDEWITGNVILAADTLIADWTPADATQVAVTDLEPAFALAPEIIILGTGHGACAPNLELMQSLAAKSIGLEIMNTPAACRTYNVLVHEQRRVVAALLV